MKAEIRRKIKVSEMSRPAAAAPSSERPGDSAFVPGVEPPAVLEQPAWWFAFSGGRLLVIPSADSVKLPQAESLAEIGLQPLRTQYLGMLRGRHCFSAEIANDPPPPEGMTWFGLRRLFGQIDDLEFVLAGRAIQIVEWDRTHQHCGVCGTQTAARAGERARVCPACGHSVYPRLAPAIMVLIRDGRRILLGRSSRFPPNMYSALAGFVEPGETIESCIEREVFEEVGVRVTNLRYFGSQPWPFPHSLMIAFFADFAGGDIVPQPEEIEDAQWFDVDSLPGLPMPISISRWLIDAAISEIRGRQP
jgi:NAD+ diphosphatase